MLPLPQTLTTNITLLSGEAAPAKGFGADTAAASGFPGFADTLRATVPVPTQPPSQGDAAGNPLPPAGKSLPQTGEPPVTGPIKLPIVIPDGVALADSAPPDLESTSIVQGLDLPRLLNRLAGRSVLPAVADVSGNARGVSVPESMPIVNLGEAVEQLATPATPLLAAPLRVPQEALLAQPQALATPVPVTIAINPALDPQAGSSTPLLINTTAIEGVTGRAAPPLLATPPSPPAKEGLTTQAAVREPDLMRPVGVYKHDLPPVLDRQHLPLAAHDAAVANTANRAGVAGPLTSRATQGVPLEFAGAERPLTRDPSVSSVPPVARDPIASAVAQQLTAPVLRPDAAALELQRGTSTRPGVAATPQNAAALTAVSDAVQMAQPAPAPQATASATLQPRTDGTTTTAFNLLPLPANALPTETARTLQGSATAIDAVAAPVSKSANVPATTVVTAAVAAPVGTSAAAMPVARTARAEAVTVTAELVPTTAKADLQPATPAPTIVAAAAAPALPPVAAPTSLAATLPPLNLPVTDSAWGDALGERVMVLAGQKLTSADIRLNPAELGPLRIEIKVDDGNTQIHFTAQHAVTREAIEQALPRLRELLSAEGLNLTGADVSENGVRRDHGGQSQSAGRDGLAQNEMVSEEPDATDDARSQARSRDGLVDTFA